MGGTQSSQFVPEVDRPGGDRLIAPQQQPQQPQQQQQPEQQQPQPQPQQQPQQRRVAPQQQPQQQQRAAAQQSPPLDGAGAHAQLSALTFRAALLEHTLRSSRCCAAQRATRSGSCSC
jgi:outer membrane biosynthesis protein TonB